MENEKNETPKFNPYDLGQVAKHLKRPRGPKYSIEFVKDKDGNLPGAYDLSRIRRKKNW